MGYTRKEMVDLVRNALEGVIHNRPHPFPPHLPTGFVDVDAFKRYFRLTSALVAYVRDEQKALARHVELLDDEEREQVFEEALQIYRAPAMA